MLVISAVLAAAGVTVTGVRADSHEITIADRAFEPAALTVLTGEPVTWTNTSSVTHTVTSDEGAELDSGPIGPGEAFGHVFDTAGVFAYHCTIHPAMQGTITVVAAAATAAPSGSPEPTPPAGTLPPDFSPFPSSEPLATPEPTASVSPTAAPTTSPAPPTPSTLDRIIGTALPVVIIGGLSGVTILALARRRRREV
jgi:plastocyanin